jgi:predicted nucleic acid-binding protein
MRVYFDNCALNRPSDEREQPHVTAEAEAMELLLLLCRRDELQLVASATLDYEVLLCHDDEKREFVQQILELAAETVSWSAEDSARARELERQGFKPMDSLHLVSAMSGLAERFCTCDTRLLKRARKHPEFPFRVVTPLELLEEVTA